MSRFCARVLAILEFCPLTTFCDTPRLILLLNFSNIINVVSFAYLVKNSYLKIAIILFYQGCVKGLRKWKEIDMGQRN